MGDTASLGSFIARSSEACAAVVILGGAALVSWVAKGGESARCPNRSLGTGTKNRDFHFGTHVRWQGGRSVSRPIISQDLCSSVTVLENLYPCVWDVRVPCTVVICV